MLEARDTAAGAVHFLSASQRGTLIHALLQRLPDVDPPDRERAAMAYLRGQISGDIGTIEDLVKESLDILQHPDMTRFFGPESRAEVDVAEEVNATEMVSGRACTISGRIDRLIVHESHIDIVDFKTGRAVPADPQDVDPAVIGQLALYRHTISRIATGRDVAAHIVWTATCLVMTIPNRLLDEALVRIGFKFDTTI